MLADALHTNRRPSTEPNHNTLEHRLLEVIDAGPQAIEARLEELDREWTVGRVIKAAAGVLILGGLLLTYFLGWPWLAVPAVGALCLLQYLFAPVSPLGGLCAYCGFRSGGKIEQERLALRTLRGDFQHLPSVHQVEDKEAISRLEDEGGIVVEMEASKVDAEQAIKEVVSATSH